jgi:lysophospholipid acyltransferase (LPLAT)-like uncharacterized protein
MSKTLKLLGMVPMEGSTKRGGAKAMRSLLRQSAVRHIALTPDGPRGPRRQIQMGSIYLASRAQMPIIPLGYAGTMVKRVGSWDRMALPCPFSTAYCVVGSPLFVPEDVSMEALEPYRLSAEKELLRVQEMSEAIAAGQKRAPQSMSLSALNKRFDAVSPA